MRSLLFFCVPLFCVASALPTESFTDKAQFLQTVNNAGYGPDILLGTDDPLLLVALGAPGLMPVRPSQDGAYSATVTNPVYNSNSTRDLYAIANLSIVGFGADFVLNKPGDGLYLMGEGNVPVNPVLYPAGYQGFLGFTSTLPSSPSGYVTMATQYQPPDSFQQSLTISDLVFIVAVPEPGASSMLLGGAVLLIAMMLYEKKRTVI